MKGARLKAQRLISRFMVLVLSGYGAKAHPKTRHAGRWARLSACSLLVIRMKNTHRVSKGADGPILGILHALRVGKAFRVNDAYSVSKASARARAFGMLAS